MISDEFSVTLEDIVEKSGAIIIAMNADSEIFYCSPAFVKMTGLDISEINGKSFVELISSHHQRKVFTELEYDGPGTREITTIIDCRNAISRVVRWNICWIFDNELPAYRVANGYDITVDVLANIAVASSPRYLTMKYMEDVFKDDFVKHGSKSQPLMQAFTFLQQGGKQES